MSVIKVGIFGARRGADFAEIFMANNAEIVAICDRNEKFIDKLKDKLPEGITYYSDA